MCFSIDKVWLNLSNRRDRLKFNRLSCQCEGDVVIKDGNFGINAKSRLMMENIDLPEPVLVEFYGEIPHNVKKHIKKLIEGMQ